MRAAEHDVVDVRVAGLGVQIVVGAALFGEPIMNVSTGLRPPKAASTRGRLRRHADDVVHLDPAGGRGRRAEMLVADQIGAAEPAASAPECVPAPRHRRSSRACPSPSRSRSATSTSIRCEPSRYSSRWKPQSGIFAGSIAALVLSRPSVLVRAPSTELQYTTAEIPSRRSARLSSARCRRDRACRS